MLPIALVPFLFILLYSLPGAVLLSGSGARWRQPQTISLAVLLSLIFAPLTFTLLSRAFPGNDSLIVAGYIGFWAIIGVGARSYPKTLNAWLPDFDSLPKADRIAWLFSILLAVIVVVLRLGMLQGSASQIGDDNFNMTKLTSIAATGLPSLYARQPLYPFAYYDLDFIAPALWVRFTGGAVSTAIAWVVHIGVQTLVSSLFLTRLMYMFARSRVTRLFGLLALHTATGLDLLFLPRLLEGYQEFRLSYPHLESWPQDLGFFDGFMQISMPFTLYVWVPQHQLGLAIVGLIFLLAVASPIEGDARTVAIAVLMVALFRTSTFVFVGALPGISLWLIYQFWTGRERMRQLLYIGAAALVAFAMLFPSLAELSERASFLEVGLSSFVFLDVPFIPWLRYPITVVTYLFLETGALLVLLVFVLLRPSLRTGSLRFWVFMSSGLLIPFLLQSFLLNDIAMRGVLPAQLSIAVIGCSALVQLEKWRRGIVLMLVIVQFVLSLATVGAELYFRFTTEKPKISTATRWIAANTPLDSLVFYEPSTAGRIETHYGYRMSYTAWNRTLPDQQYTSVPSNAWKCLPKANHYDENSLCAIEALVPGAQPVYVKYAKAKPELSSSSFELVYQSEDASVYSLACPAHEPPQFSVPPYWTKDPYRQFRAFLSKIPRDHAVAATTRDLVDWLAAERFEHDVFEIVFDLEKETKDQQTQLNRQLRAIDQLSSPVWLLLDYNQESSWNEQVLSYFRKNYFFAQPTASAAEWLECKQRFAVALPSAPEELSSFHERINFNDSLIVNEWRVGSRTYQPSEIVPMELDWSMPDDGDYTFFVHLLDKGWNLLAQIDLSAKHDESKAHQVTKMGLYLPPDLLAGDYQIRLGVYRATDGQRLTLASGEDSVHIPFTVTR